MTDIERAKQLLDIALEELRFGVKTEIGSLLYGQSRLPRIVLMLNEVNNIFNNEGIKGPSTLTLHRKE